MGKHRIKSENRRAVSLIEIMIAIFIIAIAMIGSMAYRYQSALQAKRADVQMTAGRTASTLLETWSGLRGSEDYDPEELFGTQWVISDESAGVSAPAGFTVLDTYHIVYDDVNLYATLSYKSESGNTPRQLNARVAWVYGFGTGTPGDSSPIVEMTTYTRP